MENLEMVVCFDCGEEIQIDEATLIGGEYFCSDCEDSYTECRECGHPHLEDDMHYDRCQENYVCNTCYDDCYYYTCEDCGEITEIVVSVDNGNILVCEDCGDSNYYRCDDCGNYYTSEYTRTDSNGTCICDDCFGDDYYYCYDCDEIIHTDDTYFYDDEPHCRYCYENNHANGLHDYNYKPTPIFHSVEGISNNEDNSLYLGIELEVDDGEDREEVAEKIHSDLEWIYCKEDGSLNCGFELVSHPMTLDFAINKKEDYREAFKYIINNGFRGHDTTTCGLHVHVNRTFLGDTTDTQDLNIAKIILLVNNLWSDMVKFSRRTESQLERWAKRYGLIDNVDKNNEQEVVECCKGQSNRYFAVNLQNRNTIEFRLFRSTLKLDTYYATLQLVDNICRLVKEINLRDINDITFKDIISYNKYNELTEYANKRGLL